MKVLFVFSGNRQSGFLGPVENQAKSLVEIGVQVDFFRVKGRGFLGYLTNLIPLRKQINKFQYDVVHAHYGLCGLISYFAKNPRSKLIISFMGNDLLGDHSIMGKNSISGRIYVSLSKFCASQADYVIVKSKEMASKISKKEIAIIPNGVNLAHFKMVDKQDSLEKVGWDKNCNHILFLSDPARPEKNYRLASDAFQKLNLMNLQVHFMRGIDHGDTVFFYNAADVCLLTSFHEGSPNVIKEAMACGSAIVATSVGDISDLFKGTEGCFISENDSDDVAQKIIEAFNYVKEYGKTNGRARIMEIGFDSENIANQVSDVYMKTLGFGS